MIRVIADDLGPTKSEYASREMRAIVGGTWPDARDVTVWLEMRTAKNRYWHGRRCGTTLSRYAVSEVKEIGFMGRTFVFDKEFGEAVDPSLPQPPYRVRLDCHGSISCACMGSVGKQAESCRHSDCLLALMAEDVFSDEIQGC